MRSLKAAICANLAEWNEWQKSELKKIKDSDTDEAIFTDTAVNLSMVSIQFPRKAKRYRLRHGKALPRQDNV